MDKQTNFSVAMSVYKQDKPEWVKIAIDSILNQSYKPTEVVLVVDGPVSEDLNNLICKYECDPVFKIIRLQENKGLGNALKLALDAASYELVARMDSDDISVPDRFEQQIRFFEAHADADIVGGDIAEFIDQTDNVVGIRKVPCRDEEIKTYLKTRCPMNHVSVMYKKSSVAKAGGYMDWPYNEDYYLWIRMFMNQSHFYNTGTILVNVRVGEDMYSRRGGRTYYKSEKDIQKYLLKNKIINFPTYFSNVCKRFIVQRLLPNKLRGMVFQMFARE